MVRTLKVLKTGEPVVIAAPGSGKAVNLVAVPESATVEVPDLPWEVTATVNYDTASLRLTVDELNIKRRPGGEPIPARGLRSFQLQGIVEEIARETAWKVRHKPGGEPGDLEPVERWRISASFAGQLARGRSKSQESVRRLRAQAVKEYRSIKAGDATYPDTYAEIARRLNVGRTTAYQYLKDAGEIGRKS